MLLDRSADETLGLRWQWLGPWNDSCCTFRGRPERFSHQRTDGPSWPRAPFACLDGSGDGQSVSALGRAQPLGQRPVVIAETSRGHAASPARTTEAALIYSWVAERPGQTLGGLARPFSIESRGSGGREACFMPQRRLQPRPLRAGPHRPGPVGMGRKLRRFFAHIGLWRQKHQ